MKISTALPIEGVLAFAILSDALLSMPWYFKLRLTDMTNNFLTNNQTFLVNKKCTVAFNCNTVNVAMNAKSCACHHSVIWCLSSCFAAGALAHVNVEEATAINEAVIKGDMQNACELLCAVMQGKLSGSADPLAPNYCMVLNFQREKFSGFWSLPRFNENNFYCWGSAGKVE